MKLRRTAALLALLLIVAACGDGTENAELPPVGDDVPNAAGACLEGTVDCNDMLFPGDEPVTLPPSGGSSGMPIEDGGLTVADALATDASGILIVTGFYIDSGTGPMLCDALAESFPPQCGGASIPLADISVLDPDEIQTEQTTSWIDTQVVVVGEIVNGVLIPTPMSS